MYSKSELGTKNVKRVLIPMFMDKGKRVIRANKKKRQLCYYYDVECKSPLSGIPKDLEKIAVDENSLEVFEIESAKLNNPIKIGTINKDGVVI